MTSQLRQDTDYWTDIWSALVAVAAWHVGDPDARAYLDEAVEGGFSQPETFEGELERCFGQDPDWPRLAETMAANVPPARLALLAWPELSLAHPLRFAEIAPERRDALVARLPEPQTSAWTTATELLRWVTGAWVHSASSHVAWSDALHVLERVDGGERFTCREYSIVLSQALNALDIPARSVVLLRRNHHAGLGRVHVVTEAWIDDLGAWVLLDGQNGMYWVDEDGRPLALPALRRAWHDRQPRPDIVSVVAGSRVDAEPWWPYFHTVNPTGVMMSAAPYAPLLAGTIVLAAEQLRTGAEGTHPDLLEVGIGIADAGGRPAIAPVTRHPHATGFEVRHAGVSRTLDLAGEPWPIPAETPGEHTITVATRARYGAHRPYDVRYRVAG